MTEEPKPARRLGGREATSAVIPGDFAISVGNPQTPLPDGWRWHLLTDLARLESGHTPSRKRDDYWGGDIPWIGIRDATANHGRTICNTNENTNELGIANSAARILPKDTVCLTARKRNGHVLPFVGAGMSIASGYQRWGAFLLSLLADFPQVRADVEANLARGDYEEAAQIVHDALGPGVFAEEIANQLGRHRLAAFGPVCLLPRLFEGEVLTTNFDYVLTHVYNGAQLPFTTEFCGIRLREARQRIGNDPHCLLRLHGEADAQEGRVLTRHSP